jgi:hypothetical protein
MKWIKKGKLFSISNAHDKLISHASNPLPVLLTKDTYRIFYSARDIENKSSVSYIDLDINNYAVLNVAREPVFIYGKENSFYSHGVSIGNLYHQNNKDYILFMGWQCKNGEHWRGDVGRLVLKDKCELYLEPQDAFLVSDLIDPLSLSYPWVMFDNDIYKMWYGSTVNWTSDNGEMIHIIKYATSIDGINWDKHGTAIPYELGVAQAFSKPTIVKGKNNYHMWYSYRDGVGTSYRIGYAFSYDGISWDRREKQSGINVNLQGWDSEMICYPYVFKHKDKYYMLYNGNGYGKSGFGLAVLENELE